MGNPYGITLDAASLRWAAAEGVPESVIAAICLLGEKRVDEIVARLLPAELEQVIKIPSDGLLAAIHPECRPFKVALKNEAKRPPERATNEYAKLSEKPVALSHADGENRAAPPKRHYRGLFPVADVGALLFHDLG